MSGAVLASSWNSAAGTGLVAGVAGVALRPQVILNVPLDVLHLPSAVEITHWNTECILGHMPLKYLNIH